MWIAVDIPPRPVPSIYSTGAAGHASHGPKLEADLHVDVRDHFGKWSEAKIISLHKDVAHVRYVQFPDPKWDERISTRTDWHKIAEFRKFSGGLICSVLSLSNAHARLSQTPISAAR